MDKIPEGSNRLPDATQPVNDTIKKGKLGSKQVATTDSRSRLEKKHVHSDGQSLNNRQITPDNLQMMVELGKEKQWSALASAITGNSTSLDNLISTLNTLQNNGIELPAEIQAEAGRHFIELTVRSVVPILHSNLPDPASNALGVLEFIAQQHHNHDSPIGNLARVKVGEFLNQCQLKDVYPEHLVQNMSARIFLLTSTEMKKLEDSILATAKDTETIEKINQSQNQRRIEANFFRNR